MSAAVCPAFPVAYQGFGWGWCRSRMSPGPASAIVRFVVGDPTESRRSRKKAAGGSGAERSERVVASGSPQAVAEATQKPVARPRDPEQVEQERKLCAKARTGDRAALAEILRKYGPVLYRSVLLPRLGSEAAAQDALADTYMRVVERFDQFEWRGCGVYPWLRVIAMRIALDMLRAGKRETLFDPSDLGRAVDEAERDMSDGLDAQLCEKRDLAAARERLESALETINQRYARAIRMRIVEERTREEAARNLGVSVPTFDVVLHRALTALRRAISAQEVES